MVDFEISNLKIAKGEKLMKLNDVIKSLICDQSVKKKINKKTSSL
jgi:hypothetical protein